jgi:hypothetical protein
VCPYFILKDPSVPRFPENDGAESEADWPCLRGSVALNLLNEIRNSTSLRSNVAKAHFYPDPIDPRAGHRSQPASMVQVFVVVLSLVFGLPQKASQRKNLCLFGISGNQIHFAGSHPMPCSENSFIKPCCRLVGPSCSRLTVLTIQDGH